jgi:acylphosphatase
MVKIYERRPMDDMKLDSVSRIHLWVTGVVQCVGFRNYTCVAGKVFGLVGTAENIGDDKVEVIAEGPYPKLALFANVVRCGPDSSRVDVANLTWESAVGDFKDFHAIYPKAVSSPYSSSSETDWKKWKEQYEEKYGGKNVGKSNIDLSCHIKCPYCGESKSVIVDPTDDDYYLCNSCCSSWSKKNSHKSIPLLGETSTFCANCKRDVDVKIDPFGFRYCPICFQDV